QPHRRPNNGTSGTAKGDTTLHVAAACQPHRTGLSGRAARRCVRIGIDASIAKLNRAGSGIYAASLIETLQRVDRTNTYSLFTDNVQRHLGQPKTLRSRLETIYHDVAWT